MFWTTLLGLDLRDEAECIQKIVFQASGRDFSTVHNGSVVDNAAVCFSLFLLICTSVTKETCSPKAWKGQHVDSIDRNTHSPISSNLAVSVPQL
jgi:hypothetical protein